MTLHHLKWVTISISTGTDLWHPAPCPTHTGIRIDLGQSTPPPCRPVSKVPQIVLRYHKRFPTVRFAWSHYHQEIRTARHLVGTRWLPLAEVLLPQILGRPGEADPKVNIGMTFLVAEKGCTK